MRFPLDNWLSLQFGYQFGMPTFYSDFHLGLDVVVPTGTTLYAPEDGRIIVATTGKEGGKTVHYSGKSGVLWRFLHLSVMNNLGDYRQGAVLGSTGNTGSTTKMPHLHLDISKNGALELNNRANFIDPEQYLNEHVMPGDQYNEKIIRDTSNGHYGLVVRGKLYEFTNLDVAGIFTWMQRNKMGNFASVDHDTYISFPKSNGLQF